MGKRLYVGNLSYQVSDGDLLGLFEQFGTVVSAKVVTKGDSGFSKGFGFVEMGTTEEAKAAIEALHEREYDGRPLKVEEEKSRQRRTNSDDGYSGGGGYDGGRDRDYDRERGGHGADRGRGGRDRR